MVRVTEVQRIEQANEEAALVFFREALSSLPDPRRAQETRYPLATSAQSQRLRAAAGSVLRSSRPRCPRPDQGLDPLERKGNGA